MNINDALKNIRRINEYLNRMSFPTQHLQTQMKLISRDFRITQQLQMSFKNLAPTFEAIQKQQELRKLTIDWKTKLKPIAEKSRRISETLANLKNLKAPILDEIYPHIDGVTSTLKDFYIKDHETKLQVDDLIVKSKKKRWNLEALLNFSLQVMAIYITIFLSSQSSDMLEQFHREEVNQRERHHQENIQQKERHHQELIGQLRNNNQQKNQIAGIEDYLEKLLDSIILSIPESSDDAQIGQQDLEDE
ncbi:hypothetical protein B7C51_19250 [Paenibacillus larvae subsp. pulvifaciens]|uniref:Uncharacterized protein n=1 Tax=Paenibacillus larvae subsp. pulvifaciens TaxID=1477 RepID=A0A1V0UNZ7_9BACL|nr:hypothetical protein [Paenibacillus larvae]ARF66702.1 hypothetical protein B7C51_01095 [Paenibacillus larvae subsp. pulvifaciens]ARF67065.1 hypothetical protein B7C51_03425 [Paenibacillus larvae subsp. pulvifaciens]ARF69496.1 hypothetical protein B7C51_19250 [Paenibacillus larvae subsp. pulvifaciens]